MTQHEIRDALRPARVPREFLRPAPRMEPWANGYMHGIAIGAILGSALTLLARLF